MSVHQCESWQLLESAKGGPYCGACGKDHPDPTQDPEGRALVQAIHDRKARADDAPV